jgi:hypothetical protein
MEFLGFCFSPSMPKVESHVSMLLVPMAFHTDMQKPKFMWEQTGVTLGHHIVKSAVNP